MLYWVTFVLVVVATLQALEWVVAYHRQTRGAWRKREMGRHLMAFMAAIAIVLAFATTSRFLHALGYMNPVWFDWLRVAVFVSIPAVLLWRRLLLAHAQREEKH